MPTKGITPICTVKLILSLNQAVSLVSSLDFESISFLYISVIIIAAVVCPKLRLSQRQRAQTGSSL